MSGDHERNGDMLSSIANWENEVFERARNNLKLAGMEPTPMKRSIWLSKELEADVYLKYESLQEGGSFKIRGATNYLYSYKEKHGEFPSKVIAASGGNHGIAVAVSCFNANVPCIIVIPSNSITNSKRELLKHYNVDVVVEGENFQESHEYSMRLLEELIEKGETPCYIHAYLHPWVIQGASTLMGEIVDKMKNSSKLPDIVIGSLGGGGMVAGLISYLLSYKLKNNPTKIGSAETEGADYLYQSLKAGKLITLDKITSIAKTLGASTGSLETYKLFSENIDYPMLVSDTEAVRALWNILEKEKLIVEPSCAASIAALMKYKEDFKGKKIVVILCGGNATLAECEEWKNTFLNE